MRNFLKIDHLEHLKHCARVEPRCFRAFICAFASATCVMALTACEKPQETAQSLKENPYLGLAEKAEEESRRDARRRKAHIQAAEERFDSCISIASAAKVDTPKTEYLVDFCANAHDSLTDLLAADLDAAENERQKFRLNRGEPHFRKYSVEAALERAEALSKKRQLDAINSNPIRIYPPLKQSPPRH